jgi:general secretion pathway protein D
MGKDEAAPAGAGPAPEVKPLETPTPEAKGDRRAMVEMTFAEAQDLSYLFGGAAQPLTERYRSWEGYRQASALGAGSQLYNAMQNSTGLLGGTPAGEPGSDSGGPYRELANYMGQYGPYQLPGTYVPSMTPSGQYPYNPTQPTTNPANPANPTRPEPGAVGGPLGYLLPKGLTGPPIAFAPLNALIVQGTEEAIEEFRKLVALLDQKVPQVEIESQFVEMTVSDSRAFGIDWSWLTSEVTVDAGISPGGGTFIIQYGKGNFAATLSALLQSSRARVINAPRVTTLNNYPASITFAKTTPIFLTSSVVQPGLPGGQVVTGTQLTFLPVASQLFVVPRINGDGSITTFVTPTIADSAGTVTGPGGQSVPIPTSQSMQTMLRVKNGETIVMGGFVSKRYSKSKNKIPLISDIPIVGSLFTGTSEQVTDVETLIFLTPRVIPEETPGAATTGVVVP